MSPNGKLQVSQGELLRLLADPEAGAAELRRHFEVPAVWVPQPIPPRDWT